MSSQQTLQGVNPSGTNSGASGANDARSVELATHAGAKETLSPLPAEDQSPSDGFDSDGTLNKPSSGSSEEEEGTIQKQVSKDGSIVSGTYLDYEQRLHKAWSDCPDMTVDMRNFNYTITLPKDEGVPNLLKALHQQFMFFARLVVPSLGKSDVQHIPALADITASIKPGTMTLILTPPGGGKSTMLRCLSDHFRHTLDRYSGTLTWNGLSRSEAGAKGLALNRLATYTPQVDQHYSTETVRQVIDFAIATTNANLPKDSSSELQELQKNKAELIIKMLGLEEAANTIAGNDLLRGISGGQKKRLTIAEMIAANSRLLCLDEITNGLDAAVASDICRSLRTWTRTTNGAVVAALQQPGPEIMDSFDDVIMLRDGRIVYQGPVSEMVTYLFSLGGIKPPVMDPADWVIAYLTNPGRYTRKLSGPGGKPQRQISGSVNSQHSTDQMKILRQSSTDSTTWEGAEDAIDVNPDDITTEWLAERYTKSRYHESISADQDVRQKQGSNSFGDKSQVSQITQQSYYKNSAHLWLYHMQLCLARQIRLTKSNPSLIGPRIGQAIFLGCIIGGLFFGLGTTPGDNVARVGLILSALSVTPWSNLNELPANDEAKPVLWRQVDAGFYPTSAFVIAQTIVTLPILMLEVSIVTLLIYWLGYFAPDAGRFFFFLFMVFLNDLFFSAIFRSISFATPNQFIAQQLGAPIVSLLLAFAGFLNTYNNIPDFMWEFYWISPFSWLARSISLSEFADSRYDDVGIGANGQFGRQGNNALAYWQMQQDWVYKWSTLAIVIGYYMIGLLIITWAISHIRYEASIGTFRPKESEMSQAQLTRQSSIDMNKMDRAKTASASSAIPFEPVTLVWKNIDYTVTLKDKSQKQLLYDISAYCEPGECTALMGSSGAGKTTLMDVVAGRKTEGVIAGKILVNGYETDSRTFQSLIGYAEQQDLHMPFITVRESLLFSASLRLPATVTKEQRDQFVDELLLLLELDGLKNRIVGNSEINGLSPGQTKLVTIGVELASNPSILFLDEPTTGLDSRAALSVMRVVRKIAATGRTVLCTIHQPSSELFFMFDRLVLLRTGGTMVYNGLVGEQGNNIIDYFEEVGTTDNFKPEHDGKMNPATFMLEVLMEAKDKNVDHTKAWSSHSLKGEADEALKKYEQPSEVNIVEQRKHLKKVNFMKEFLIVQQRQFRSYWRNVAFNYVRCMIQLILGIIYGLLYLNLAGDVRNGGAGQEPAKINSVLGGLLMGLAFPGCLNCAVALPVITSERAVFYREKSSNTYSPWSYGLALLFVEIPFIALNTIFFVLPYYYLADFIPDGVEFCKFYLMCFLISLTINALGHWLAAVLPNLIVSSQIQGLFFTFVFQFGGVFIRFAGPGGLTAGWKWIYYMNPVPKAINAIALAQFSCTAANCPTAYFGDTDANGNPVPTNITDYLSNDYLGAPTGSAYYAQQVGWIWLTWAVLRIFASVSLRYVSYLKR